MLLIFVWREFTVRYRQSSIGILWALVQPLSMMLLFLFIFSYVMKVQNSSYPQMLFFYAGLLPWLFFSSSLNYSIPSLTSQYQLITKIYFPREILPISGIAVAFIDYLIAAALFVVFLVIYQIKVSWLALWMIPLTAMLVLFTTSVSIFLSGLNVYYRDVKLATAFLLQLWFFASPVMYSIDKLDMKIKLFLFLNPLTFIIENMRRCVLEGRDIVYWQFFLVGGIVALSYKLAYRYFIKIERAFADVI
ncbi:ABC transporter permease [Candidatus Magnetomonas plexicatena]|uniref:ABC transporter permease n=1 Tax=Candidatus Magnetomonas plexicatena TaxID=2552947 RepID=UPI001C76CC40|nr:ABC transporter permease [Nitrospirales bacterium LBB_01]